MMSRIWICFLLCAMGLPSVSPAQVRITKSPGEKSTIDLSGMIVAPPPAAQLFQQTLQSSLSRSGWFMMGRAGQSEVRVLGSADVRGQSINVECSVFSTGSRQQLMNKSYRHDAADARRLAHRVADDIIEAVTGQKGISSTRIVMVGTRSGKKELYVCDADGGNLIQLTQDHSIAVRPRWGPQGDKIIYTAYIQRFPDIYMIDVPTGRRSVVSNFSGLNSSAAISPDGRDVALILSKDGNPELYVMNLSSRRVTRLTHTPSAAESSPSWSPDGRRLVYVSDQAGRPQLYIISRDGGRPERLTSRGSENVAPDWGRNGWIAHSSRLGGKFQVAIIHPDTREVRPVPNQTYADYEDPSWAPNGRHIVCSRKENYRSTVYILDTLGDPPIRLIEHGGDWYSPAWSPN